MSDQMPVSFFTDALFALFQETFVGSNEYNYYLNKNNSIFETLETISAAEASIPVSSTCASIAAQVEHVTFYIDVFEDYILQKPLGKVDWDEIWARVEAVTPEEWEASKARLRQSYERVLALLQGFDAWDTKEKVEGALGIVAHTAYHLGEIRQATCTVRAS